MAAPAIVWFRRDLRLADHVALTAASSADRPVIPLFIWSPEDEGEWAPGAASRWWLHQSLEALGSQLADVGSRLILRRGPALDVLRELIEDAQAEAVFWHRRYDPASRKRDEKVKKALGDDGIEATSFNGSLLLEPWEVKTQKGDPYQVFTPFWRTCRKQLDPDEPLPAPDALVPPQRWPDSDALKSFALEPELAWPDGIAERWHPRDEGAHQRLDSFARDRVEDYPSDRDIPSVAGTSSLSPHLHFGEISPRQVYHRLAAHDGSGADKFLAEIGWREFAHHLLLHFPHTPDQPLREAFADYPWEDDAESLRAWQRGRTGYPIVDAGMRELWATGWMHNRVRMSVASFLVKDLHLPWQAGARWFWDTLVDADLANNTLGWQWSAGCGADAAPYFRIFNPVTQGERYDPQGAYIRRWVPELRELPDKLIHKPWKASAARLAEAGVTLGEDYPEPIVDHSVARDKALEGFERIKGK